MNLSRPQAALVLTMVGLVAATAVILWWPVASGTRTVGWQGNVAGGVFRVMSVAPGSPAHESGIVPGDRIRSIDGTPIAAWHEVHSRQWDRYLVRLLALERGTVEVVLDDTGEGRRVLVGMRPLEPGDMVRLYLFRLVFAVTLIALAALVVTSAPRDPVAFSACVPFCLLALWVSTGIRVALDRFLPPLVHALDTPPTMAAQSVEFFALPLLVGSILHLSLRFPVDRAGARWLPVLAAWIVPLLPLLAGIPLHEGSWLARLEDLYPMRRWLASALLAAASILFVLGLKDCRSPVRRLQSRWIVGAVLVAAVAVIGLWNLPVLLVGRPLVPDYDWVLLWVLLVPAATALSISSHGLFGLRGLIRRRLRVLERQFERRGTQLASRDRDVAALSREINALRAELASYSAAEHRQADAGGEGAGLARLEQQHPVIAQVRREWLLGASPAWRQVFEDVVLAARGRAPVLVVGESGTGKTDLAWTIHALGDHAGGPYRAVSCAQFEHADPAFALGRLFGIGTGHGLPGVPAGGQPGLLQECDGGTLFLDDFDRLPLNVQDLLLYPLEDRPFEPGVGRGPARHGSVRFILATNRDPAALVRDGSLRPDVLARLGARVDVPPLRERREDIPLLVEHFTRDLAGELGHEIRTISAKAMERLRAGDYAGGNARELRALLRTAIGRAMHAGEHELRAGHLGEPSQHDGGADTSGTGPGIAFADQGERELAVLRRNGFNMRASEADLGYSHKSRTLSHHLRGICVLALRDNDWHVAPAARAVAGPGCAERATIARLERRMHALLATIRSNVEQGTQSRLYRNLPSRYHDALGEAIERAKRPGNAPPE